MQIGDITTSEAYEIVRKMNETYNDNIVIENLTTRGNRLFVKLGTVTSRGLGTRHSHSGRHGKYACTHVFEDFMRGVILAGGMVVIPKNGWGNAGQPMQKLENVRELDNWVYAFNANSGAEDQCNHCSAVDEILSMLTPSYAR